VPLDCAATDLIPNLKFCDREKLAAAEREPALGMPSYTPGKSAPLACLAEVN